MFGKVAKGLPEAHRGVTTEHLKVVQNSARDSEDVVVDG